MVFVPRAGGIVFNDLQPDRSRYPMEPSLVRELMVPGVEIGAVLVAGVVFVVVSYTAHGIGSGVISRGVRVKICGAITRAGAILFYDLRSDRSSFPAGPSLVREPTVSGVENNDLLVVGAVLVVMRCAAQGIGWRR